MNHVKAKKMESNVAWSNSNVRDVLTPYALGLFCKKFDRQKDYYTTRISEYEWISSYKDHFEKEDISFNCPSFIRVRKVTLSKNGFMNCDCGKTGEFLLPCAHIFSVVKEDKYFTPDTFHIRWHHHFSYAYVNVDENDYTPRSTELMTEMFDDIRQNHYDKNGYFKGICFSKTEFLKRLPRFIPEFRPNEKKNVMLKVMELSKKKSILVGKISAKTYIEFDIDQYYGGIEMSYE